MMARRPPNVDEMYTLKVDNISFRMNEDELSKIFERYGEIGDVYIPKDFASRQSKGFAFVRFVSRRDAEDAMEQVDGKVIEGREIRVAKALHPRPPGGGGGGGYGGGGYGGSRGYDRYEDRGRRDRHDDRDRYDDRDRRDRDRNRDDDRDRDRDRSGSQERRRERRRSRSRSRSRSGDRRRRRSSGSP